METPLQKYLDLNGGHVEKQPINLLTESLYETQAELIFRVMDVLVFSYIKDDALTDTVRAYSKELWAFWALLVASLPFSSPYNPETEQHFV